jgi:hypothetical protein
MLRRNGCSVVVQVEASSCAYARVSEHRRERMCCVLKTGCSKECMHERCSHFSVVT